MDAQKLFALLWAALESEDRPTPADALVLLIGRELALEGDVMVIVDRDAEATFKVSIETVPHGQASQ